MMRHLQQLTTSFSVGFVLFVATVLAVGSLFWVGSAEDLFSSTVTYEAYFPSTSGLVKGARVHLSGVPVGTVQSIGFSDDMDDNRVVVLLAVDEAVTPRIHTDSYVWLETQGLLGDMSVHITLGAAGAEMLPPGSTIEYRPRPLLADLAGEEMTETASDLMRTLIQILTEIHRGEGTMGKLLKDPELYDNLTAFSGSLDSLTRELRTISADVESVIAEVKEEKGTLGKLVFSREYEEHFSLALQDASKLVTLLRQAVEDVHSGNGSLGKLVRSSELHDQAITALRSASEAAGTLSSAVGTSKEKSGIIGRLISDEQLGENFALLVERLERAAASMENVLDLLENGEGSLGIALRDPSIAISLRNMFLGVQEYGYLKSIVRNLEEDGRRKWLTRVRSFETARRETLRARALARIGEAPDERPGGATDPGEGPSREPGDIVPVSLKEDASEPEKRLDEETQSEEEEGP